MGITTSISFRSDAFCTNILFNFSIYFINGMYHVFISFAFASCFFIPPGIIQVILNGRWELLLQFPFVLMLFAQIFFLILVFIPGMERIWYLALWLLLAITPAFGGHVWGMENPVLALIPRI